MVEIGLANWMISVFLSTNKQRRMKVSRARNPNRTEPNQALQRMNCIVTDRAPSSTLRANAVHRWAWTFGKIIGVVFPWFQFSELFSTSLSYRKYYRPSCWFWLFQVVVWLSESNFGSRDLFRNVNLTQKIFSKTGSCREAEKNSKNDLKSPKKIAHAYGSKSKF